MSSPRSDYRFRRHLFCSGLWFTADRLRKFVEPHRRRMIAGSHFLLRHGVESRADGIRSAKALVRHRLLESRVFTMPSGKRMTLFRYRNTDFDRVLESIFPTTKG